MKNIIVPTLESVSQNNRAILEQLKGKLGFVPNLYATFAHSENGLSNVLAVGNLKTSMSTKEKEVIFLAVSEVNNCKYCLAAHTVIGKANGFTEHQTIEFRLGKSSHDKKLDALARLAKNLAENKGNASPEVLENFFAQGYTEGSLVDTVILVGEKTMANYLHSATQVPIDFPQAPQLVNA